MSLLVVKFGGTSVKDIDRIRIVAEKVKQEVALGHQVVVVVSAMAGVTNQLVDYCSSITSVFDAREYDVVVSTGEQVTSGLLALALEGLGVRARSWLGWQVPIKTDDVFGKARIEDIETDNILSRLQQGEVVVIPGFQGVTAEHRVTTLGRGGSDTTAVALAAALKADRCDIYTDVDGVYTTDPRITSKARKIDKISFEEMLEMASLGAKVLQTRSVEMAMKHNIPVQVLSSYEDHIGSSLPGTLVVEEESIVEKHLVTGITYNRDEAKITLTHVADTPGIAARIFGPLADAAINVDMIVQNISQDGLSTDMTFTVPKTDLDRAVRLFADLKEELAYDRLLADHNVAKISIVGVGMRSHAGVAQTMFRILSEKGINISVISTSEIKISVLISEDYTELAIRALHDAYQLEQVKVSEEVIEQLS